MYELNKRYATHSVIILGIQLIICLNATNGWLNNLIDEMNNE